MNILYIYSQWTEGGGYFGWLERGKENKDTRNPSLHAFHFSHHIYISVKRKLAKDFAKQELFVKHILNYK